jgi:hypothetical protein
MVRKTCEQCGNEAAVAVCWLVSTVGISPRVQKCSRASGFCLDCLKQFGGGEQGKVPPQLLQRLREAYTATIGQSLSPINPFGRRSKVEVPL